ncbi:MAG: hypothetical protein IH598_12020 [Bacteroidales bacterium]|nr:hypothetical protein [Bacteroidales bacterium]
MKINILIHFLHLFNFYQNMKKQVLLVVAVLAMVVLTTSCQKVPQEQIDAAKAAVESVKAVQADLYVPAEYAALQDSLQAVLAAVEIQKSKTFKNFDAVKLQLEGIMATVPQVTANAAAAKEQVRIATEGEVVAINTILEENRVLITKAPKGKEGAAVLEEIKNEMTLIETAVAEVNQMLANGDFLGAQVKAKAAKESAMSINTELTEAIAKVKR